MTRNLTMTLLLAAALALTLGAPAQEPPTPTQESEPIPMPEGMTAPQAPAAPVKFEGTVVDTGGNLRALAGFFTVKIDRWSTDEEVAELKRVLATGGQEALQKKVWKAKQVGYMTIGGSLGKAIYAAKAVAVPGGLVVRVLTNNCVAKGGGRVADYPFAFAEIIIPNGEKGHGTLVPTAQIGFNAQGGVTVEALGTLPLKLMDVGIQEPKKKK